MPTPKSNLPITSREYKLLLKPEKFEHRIPGSRSFYTVLESIVNKSGGQLTKSNEDLKRITWFIDTPEELLLKQNFILRIRDEEGEEKRYKITLKFRHEDRYISSTVAMDSVEKTTYKFEQDILPPFSSKYSQSVTFRKNTLPVLNNVADVLKLFPKIHLRDIDLSLPLVVRSDFKAYELSQRLAIMHFDEDMPIKACLNYWYRTDDYEGIPVCAEFSYDYDAKLGPEIIFLEDYPRKIVKRAYEVFHLIQNESEWYNPDTETKTTLVSKLKAPAKEVTV